MGQVSGGIYSASGTASEVDVAAVYQAKTSDAINSATALLAAMGGGKAYLAAGSWQVTTPVIARSNVTIEGAGRGTVLDLAAASTHVVTIGAVSGFRLKNLDIDGHRTTYPSSGFHGIFADPAVGGYDDLLIEDVRVRNAPSAGILLQANTATHATNVRIVRCNSGNSGWHGIICQDYVDFATVDGCVVDTYSRVYNDGVGITNGRNGLGPKVTDGRVDGTGALGTQGHGISMDGTLDRTVCTGNQAANTVGYGIEIGFVTDGVFSENVVTGCTRACMAFSGNGAVSTSKSTGVVISGNELSLGAAQGLYFFMNNPGSTFHASMAVNGNVIRQCAASGMELNYAKHLGVSGNTVTDCGLSGIYVASTCDAYEIGPNKLFNNNTTANAAHGGLRILTVAGAHAATVAQNDVRGSGVVDYYYTEDGARIDGRFRVGDTTPTVAFGNVFFTANTGATSITNLDDAKDGETYTIRAADAFTTLVHNTSAMRLSGGVNYAMPLNAIVRLVKSGGVLWETSRLTTG